MKTVFVKPRFRRVPLHNLYNYLTKNPLENYKVVIPQVSKPSQIIHAADKSQNSISKALYHYFVGLPYILTQTMLPLKGYEKYDLIFASQHVINCKQPWIADFEFANALAAYSDISLCTPIIKKLFKSKSCKAILPFSNWAAETLRKSMDCKEFEDKIKILRPTVPSKKISKKKNDGEIIRILFVGSSNPANILDFEYKGLNELVDAFLKLQNKYDNLELVIRSKVSEEIKQKVKNFQNIKIIENILSPSELEELYLSSDIFPHVGYLNLNAAIFEAMSYGIPVIATSLYNIPELVKDMKNGLLIKLPNPDQFYTKNGCPIDLSRHFPDIIRKLRPHMAEKLKTSLELLIEDESLRKKLSAESIKPFQDGEFSINQRQDTLKEVFDSATTK